MIGTVVDGENGDTPTITATKSGTNTIIKVDGTTIATIADGAKGDKGDKGEQGIQGIQGIQGPQGEDGNDAAISVSKSGNTATITAVSGDGTTTTTTVTDGTNGKTAYQSAVSGGYAGTESKFNTDLADVSNKAPLTIIREYSNGVLVGKVGQTVGALVNANGSFDVRELTWNNNVPTAGNALATFGTDTTIGANNRAHLNLSSLGITMFAPDGSTQLTSFLQETGVIDASLTPSSVPLPYFTIGLRKSGEDKGAYSTAAGYNCVASGPYSFAEGINTSAISYAGHAEGYKTIAGRYSHAEGSQTEAYWEDTLNTDTGPSHVGGSYSKAYGFNAFAHGNELIAHAAQTVFGISNVEATASDLINYDGIPIPKYAFVIGNGDWSPTNIGAERSNAFVVDWNGNVMAQGFAGMIQMFAGSTTPTGWLFCDGSQYLKTDYPELYATIGDIYGDTSKGWVAPTSSSYFRVPDLRGRFPIGVGNGTASGHTNHALASGSGAEKVTLSAANMPYHRHSIPALSMSTYAGFKPSLQVCNVATGSTSTSDNPLTYAGAGRGTTNKNNAFTGASNTGGSHTHTTNANNTGYAGGSSGAATAHENMPPYIGVNFIIATGKTS